MAPTIEVTEGGETFLLGRGEPTARVTVHDRRVYSALLRSASVGLGTSYVAGWWDTDDLTALVRALARDTRPLRECLDRLGRAWGSVLDVPARLATPGREDDKRNIAEHYDLSNDFFAIMLDETMTYSCAVFERPGATLTQAQETKIDQLCTKLELSPTDHMIEIGSGWGGLAVHAATRYGCRVTTTTISDAQRTYVEKRVADAGLADRVTVLGLDWRDLTGRFDKLVSVEMVEAVDWRWHDQFLAKCSRPSDRQWTGRHPGHRDRRPKLRAGQASSGFRSPHGLSRRVPPVGDLAHDQPRPCHRLTRRGPARTSATTTSRRCDAGRTTWPCAAKQWRPWG